MHIQKTFPKSAQGAKVDFRRIVVIGIRCS